MPASQELTVGRLGVALSFSAGSGLVLHYELVHRPEAGEHPLSLTVLKGVEACAFTVG